MNDDQETASGEGMPEPREPLAPARRSGGTTLRVTDPFYCTGMVFPGDGEATLVIDRRGVEVPAGQAEALIATAAEHGVTLRSNT